MREAELKEMGFKKIQVPDEESNNGYDYYYYRLDITPQVRLVSCDSDVVDEDGWFVKNFDWPDVSITDVEDVKLLVQLYKKWTK
jgi:hypothetical protein